MVDQESNPRGSGCDVHSSSALRHQQRGQGGHPATWARSMEPWRPGCPRGKIKNHIRFHPHCGSRPNLRRSPWVFVPVSRLITGHVLWRYAEASSGTSFSILFQRIPTTLRSGQRPAVSPKRGSEAAPYEEEEEGPRMAWRCPDGDTGLTLLTVTKNVWRAAGREEKLVKPGLEIGVGNKVSAAFPGCEDVSATFKP